MDVKKSALLLYTPQLTKLREKLLQLVEQEGKVKAHKAAIMRVGLQYRPTLEKSDFAELLQQQMQPDTK